MPRVINTSARVKPFLRVSCVAAQNGSLPAPIPRLVLKLRCPPPRNCCYHCVFHNLVSFLWFMFFFSLFINQKYLFSRTHSHYVHAIVSKRNIFDYFIICVSLTLLFSCFTVNKIFFVSIAVHQTRHYSDLPFLNTLALKWELARLRIVF